MSLTALLLVCVALGNAGLGAYVVRRNVRSGSHRAFAAMAFAIGLWTMGLTCAHYVAAATTWALRAAFAASSLIPIAVVFFVRASPSQTAQPLGLAHRVMTVAGLTFSGLSLSPWIIASASRRHSIVVAQYGPLHPAFIVFLVASFGYSIAVLIRSYRMSDGPPGVHARNLIVALALPGGLAVGTAWLGPLLSPRSSASKYGPFLAAPALALLGHAMLRPGVLTPRALVERSGVTLAALGLTALVALALLLAPNVVTWKNRAIPAYETAVALIAALVFQPLRRTLARVCAGRPDAEAPDHERALREASRALGGVLDVASLLDSFADALDCALRPERLAVYLAEAEGGYRLAKVRSDIPFAAVLPDTDPVVETLARRKELVFRSTPPPSSTAIGALAAEFDRQTIDTAIPLVVDEAVIGLLVIGASRARGRYTDGDTGLLTALTSQFAVAIRGAQIHQRMLQMDEELHAVLGTIDSGIAAVTGQREITIFNGAAERLSGVTAARARRVEHLPGPLARCLVGTLGDEQPRSSVEFWLADATGAPVPIVCWTVPLVNSPGRPVGAVAVFRDASPLKELEHERRRAERLDSLEALASGLVHEIRNPLAALKTFCSLLPTRYHDADYRDTFARVAGREIGRMDSLVTRFRTLTAASGQPLEPLDITDPIQHTLDLLEPQFAQQQMRIRRIALATPRLVLGNVGQLEQLFLNLCMNALEAMGSGGELTVRVADASESEGATLLVELSDTGVGIPESLLPDMFTPFVTTKVGGTGLGLAICRSIADRHRARLRARNNAGRPGCTVSIEFPISPMTPPSAVAT